MTGKQDRTTPARAALQAQIDENLRKVYAETLNADVPDRFAALIDRLRRETPATPATPASGDDDPAETP